jgi:hypothetical protein
MTGDAVLNSHIFAALQLLCFWLQCHLWRQTNVMEAEATAAIFQDRGIMRIACLADGSAWALVQPDQLARLQARAHSGMLCGTFGSCKCGTCVWIGTSETSLPMLSMIQVVFCLYTGFLPAGIRCARRAAQSLPARLCVLS